MRSAAVYRWPVLVALVLLVAGCTADRDQPSPSPSPTPSPAVTPPPITGPRVAVVRAPNAPIASSEDADLAAIERIRSEFDEQISEVRDVVAQPADFFPDVVELMAEAESSSSSLNT